MCARASHSAQAVPVMPQAEEAAKQAKAQSRTEISVSNGVMEQIAQAEAARQREARPDSSVDAETKVSDAMVRHRSLRRAARLLAGRALGSC